MSETLDLSKSYRLRVGKDIDGTWYVVKDFGDGEFDYPADWIAEGVGSWGRAMWWALDHIRDRRKAR